ncbi:MAG: hypothetical protein ACRCUJ_12185 [Phocaeicola sp.]
MKTSDLYEAKRCARREIKSKNDLFVALSALNLLNAAVKIELFKEQVGYGFIKPAVSRIIQHCMKSNESNFFDDICYDAKRKCAYLRCFGLQFSFHNVNTNCIDDEIITLISEHSPVWDGVRLQPVALELYQLAKECQLKGISDSDAIMGKFQEFQG